MGISLDLILWGYNYLSIIIHQMNMGPFSKHSFGHIEFKVKLCEHLSMLAPVEAISFRKMKMVGCWSYKPNTPKISSLFLLYLTKTLLCMFIFAWLGTHTHYCNQLSHGQILVLEYVNMSFFLSFSFFDTYYLIKFICMFTAYSCIIKDLS